MSDRGPVVVTPWHATVSVSYNYFDLSPQSDLVQPTATVDYGALHLEARYNYEARETGSVWAGWSIGWGNAVRLALIPMVGGVFGDVDGVATGVEWDLTWGPLEAQSTNEFVFDLTDWSTSDFNYWAELRIWPLGWLRTGFALQHTRAIHSARAVQWGPLVGVQLWKVNAAAYWMSPGQRSEQYWVASVAIAF